MDVREFTRPLNLSKNAVPCVLCKLGPIDVHLGGRKLVRCPRCKIAMVGAPLDKFIDLAPRWNSLMQLLNLGLVKNKELYDNAQTTAREAAGSEDVQGVHVPDTDPSNPA